ncbi:TerC/Alx family metal homeostasis membrane protein [Oleispirillum naphthae]|uniref:TerC/Alx family metal homeostasis membrane protein n=1 Tax=Oleispirillum naphthae TaxID=2838853 RepID=UPI0030825885
MFDQLWPLAGTAFMGWPVLVWCGLFVLVGGLLAFDLKVLNRTDHAIGFAESLATTLLYVAVAAAFGGGVWGFAGAEAGMLYFTAFLVEKSLSLDNVFVISTIFAAFAVPAKHQHRVLFWGILGAVVMRGAMIVLGSAMIARFHWILFAFGAFLLLSGVKALLTPPRRPDAGPPRLLAALKRLLPVTAEFHGHAFFARTPGGRLAATPLLPALIVVEAADAIFAVDSIPAVLSITGDPFIVLSSNIFAILGLRALYSVLAVMVGRFVYLRHGLAAVLMFIGAKIFWGELVGPVPAAVSLAVTVALLGGAVAASLLRGRLPAFCK